jgi:hypothetical protein
MRSGPEPELQMASEPKSVWKYACERAKNYYPE